MPGAAPLYTALWGRWVLVPPGSDEEAQTERLGCAPEAAQPVLCSASCAPRCVPRCGTGHCYRHCGWGSDLHTALWRRRACPKVVALSLRLSDGKAGSTVMSWGTRQWDAGLCSCRFCDMNSTSFTYIAVT